MREPTTTHWSIAEIVARYNQAWADHDVAAVLALQSDDMVFHLQAAGNAPVTGVESLRAEFRQLFELLPDLAFDTTRLDIGADFYVHEYQIRASGGRVESDGSGIGVPAVDVIRCRSCQVTRKDTYVDSLALSAQLGVTGS